MQQNKKIFVTQPSLPKLEDFVASLETIWKNKWITNNGEFHQQFEKDVAKFLNVPFISIYSNGTLALMAAIKILNLTGEIITTPYSFVATTNSIEWNGLRPVFTDVDKSGNIDVSKIEKLITKNTSAILPVHVYGNPVETKNLDEIAKKHDLKVIYDAAHAFGVKKNDKSILLEGDLSVLSFHATKIFNSIEGGAIVCKDLETKQKLDQLKNFGFEHETSVTSIGFNAKMNEIQAAYGSLQLKMVKNDIEKCKALTKLYKSKLENIKGIKLLEIDKDLEYNYAYFPIFIQSNYSLTREELYHKFKENNVYVRRYFYPLISNFSMYSGLNSSKKEHLPNANKLSEQVLCLPLYAGLSKEDVIKIINLI